jgi:hypothetical protein
MVSNFKKSLEDFMEEGVLKPLKIRKCLLSKGNRKWLFYQDIGFMFSAFVLFYKTI